MVRTESYASKRSHLVQFVGSISPFSDSPKRTKFRHNIGLTRTPEVDERFWLTNRRTNGKLRDSLQSGKVVR